MYVSNRVDFGHLVNADNFDISRVNPDIWELFTNRWDWEIRYIHENYTHYISENTTVEMVSYNTSYDKADTFYVSQM